MRKQSGRKVVSQSQDARGREREMNRCLQERGCALLADRHLGLAEDVRGLLEAEFEAVVVVGDEVSLFESARQCTLLWPWSISRYDAETG